MNTKQKDKVLSCLDIANYFLVLVDREAGDAITQLKLYKLIYFAQGINLALFDELLFEEEIEAWTHGPVAPALRSTFGIFEANIIPTPREIDFDIYSQKQKGLIYKVYSLYGEHTAAYLRNLTHTHSIWCKAIMCDNKIITKEEMHKFFQTDVIKDIKDYLLSISKEDIAQIENAEDQWWMNYDSIVPAEDITKQLLKAKKRKEIDSHLLV
ncbi:Panacea domain-containing protein [Rickettsia endosymbiont of Oedothorax gibbosus]|uniref:Panacea domain-containing protein n=1 Tax=Rickettsia endosymbiont of Oedothorax gibbosus TaxID=931099 RepID=UPI0020257089|nr:type II toxin-antitoxin system antitoxin SocA domain-containing protein [Rickettsia endosymbiont of Oedothorax gibbosus]